MIEGSRGSLLGVNNSCWVLTEIFFVSVPPKGWNRFGDSHRGGRAPVSGRTEVVGWWGGRGGKMWFSSMGTNWVFIKPQGHQVTFPLSLPFSLSLFSVSLSPLLFLFVFHSAHVTQPLKNVWVLMSSSVQLEIHCRGYPWNWAGPAASMGVQLINCFILICVFMCNHACVRVCVWERPHACHSY